MYLLFIVLLQMIFAACFSFFLFLFPSLSSLVDLLDGAAGIITVSAGTCLVFLYAEIMKNRGVLEYSGRTAFGSVFAKNRSIGADSFAGLCALIFIMQFASSYVLGIIETVLNTVGLTAMNSPAMNADYSLSITLLLYAVLIGPAAEELVFRGFILKGLEPCGKVFSVLVSAVLFSLMHGDIQQIYFTFVVGIILGYAASEYSVWVSFLLHVFNNGVISMLLTYGLSAFPDFVYYIVMGILLAVSAAVLVLMVITGKMSRLEAFFHSGDNTASVYMSLINPWFVIFAVFCGAEILFSLSAL